MELPVLAPEIVAVLINEWATVPQERSARPWGGYPEEASPARAGVRSGWPAGEALPADEAVREAGDALYPLFEAADGVELAARANTVIECLGLRPCVREDGESWGWCLPSHSSESRVLCGAMLAAVLDVVGSARGAGLGICGAEDCGDVYLDPTGARRRRYCTPRCQTRQRVREHRRRNRRVP